MHLVKGITKTGEFFQNEYPAARSCVLFITLGLWFCCWDCFFLFWGGTFVSKREVPCECYSLLSVVAVFSPSQNCVQIITFKINKLKYLCLSELMFCFSEVQAWNRVGTCIFSIYIGKSIESTSVSKLPCSFPL